MKVIGEKVLIQVDKQPELCTQKIGSLSIPVGPNAGEYEVATIKGIGEKIDPSVLEVGAKIYIYFGSGKKINYEGEEYRVITLNEIIVVL